MVSYLKASRFIRVGAATFIIAALGLAACGDDESAATAAGGGGASASQATTSANGGSGVTTSTSTSGIGGAGAGGSGSLPLAGFGNISGACDVLDAMDFTSASPDYVETTIDFGQMAFDYNALSPGGQELHDAGNLNQSSLYSEIFAYEVLYRCELAELLETEGTIDYDDPNGKKTDFLAQINMLQVGVSVTRAVGFPPNDPYTVDDARILLEDKLADIPLSTDNAKAPHEWVKQILLVLAYEPQHVAALQQAYAQLGAALKGDTIVYTMLTNGADNELYFAP